MPLQIRAPRVAEDRRPIIGKSEVSDFARQRRGLREISNIPSHVTKKIADLKITTSVSQRTAENQKLTKLCGVSNVLKDVKKPISEKNVKPAKKPGIKHEIEDIDKLHEGNIYLVSEYAKDVYSYLLTLEDKMKISKWPLNGSKITDGMRTILVDWLVDVHVEFHLLQETIHTAISILDRYLQINTNLEKNVFQLVGVCALSLACKYEEMLAPLIDDFLYLCKNTYQRKELIDMEKEMLKALNYDLGRPVSVIFLRRYNMAAKADKLQHCYSKYLIDMALLDSKFCHIRPSMIAAGAAYVAMCIIRRKVDTSFWTPTMVHYSSYSLSDVEPIASQLSKMIIVSSKSKYDSVRRKYADSLFLGVSMKIVSSMEIIKKIASSSTTVAVPL